jgi:drug/metabolite transporter (DMT)-like permease
MDEVLGVAAAAASSALGGTSIGATRFIAGALDPLAIGAFRFGIGFVLLLPIILVRRMDWPRRRDLPAIIGLGLLFFALYPILFNAAFIYTTAAHGALTLATLPLLSIVIGALMGREVPTPRKTAGVFVAMAGVGVVMVTSLKSAADGAWRGDLLMLAAVICMAFYGVWSKPYLERAGTIPFTVVAMGAGGLALTLVTLMRGGFAPVAAFDGYQWSAVLYLGAIGGAFSFYLWSYALGHTSPTRVALTVTINPVTASLYGAFLLNEPMTATLLAGIVLVALGIWLGTSGGRVRRKVGVAEVALVDRG